VSALGSRLALLLALVAGLLAASPAADAGSVHMRVGSYVPPAGPNFNNPIGTPTQQRKLLQQVIRTVNSTPAGATIRMAVFSFSHVATADRLVKAYKRGVNVQAIFNDHKSYGPERRLVRVLGSKTSKGSFAKFCSDSCRGYKGNMHQKVFLFSKAGSAHNIVMVGSDNMTRNNAVNQWSDLYTLVGDPAMYFTYAGVFDQMKIDRPQRNQYIAATINGYGPEFYPYPNVTQYNDPLYLALSKVECLGAADGYGTDTGVDNDGDGYTGLIDCDDWDPSIGEGCEGEGEGGVDSDGDGIDDGPEVTTVGTDPKRADTDGDGFSDGDEVNANTDPNDPTSHQ